MAISGLHWGLFDKGAGFKLAELRFSTLPDNARAIVKTIALTDAIAIPVSEVCHR
jgi:hypothetical protein